MQSLLPIQQWPFCLYLIQQFDASISTTFPMCLGIRKKNEKCYLGMSVYNKKKEGTYRTGKQNRNT